MTAEALTELRAATVAQLQEEGCVLDPGHDQHVELCSQALPGSSLAMFQLRLPCLDHISERAAHLTPVIRAIRARDHRSPHAVVTIDSF